MQAYHHEPFRPFTQSMTTQTISSTQQADLQSVTPSVIISQSNAITREEYITLRQQTNEWFKVYLKTKGEK